MGIKVIRVMGRSISVRDIVIVKVVICVGLLSIHFLPAEHAMLATTVSNMLWLWRT